MTISTILANNVMNGFAFDHLEAFAPPGLTDQALPFGLNETVVRLNILQVRGGHGIRDQRGHTGSDSLIKPLTKPPVEQHIVDAVQGCVALMWVVTGRQVDQGFPLALQVRAASFSGRISGTDLVSPFLVTNI